MNSRKGGVKPSVAGADSSADQLSNSNPKAWGDADVSIESNYASPVPGPFEPDLGKNEIIPESIENKVTEIAYTDDEMSSDDWDSDESQKSHDTCKNSWRFKAFFGILNDLSDEKIDEPARQWHCPACLDGAGAIDRHEGIQPLITHLMKEGSSRVKIHQELLFARRKVHRKLSLLLHEELDRKGMSNDTFGKWKGLVTVKDHEIVWPPTLVIKNAKHQKDENDMWDSMGTKELLRSFDSYGAVQAKHCFGNQHSRMFVLIFESSEMGYLKAKHLDKHFTNQGTGREAWVQYFDKHFKNEGTDREADHCVPINHEGKHQLYGYMAEKADMEYFNDNCREKMKLKFEIRSYEEVVVSEMKQMGEVNQQRLDWFKNKVAKEQRHSKAPKESFGILSEKRQKTSEENLIVRQRTEQYLEEYKEKMDSWDPQICKEKLRALLENRVWAVNNFEGTIQLELEKVEQTNTSNTSDHRHRAEEIAKFIEFREEFVAEKEKLLKDLEQKKLSIKRKYMLEKLELEVEFGNEFNLLTDKYRLKLNGGKKSGSGAN